ncbi:hypothetical protein [Streptomyces sp. PA5.6]|uniref:hypothetical protein n=1 Tax=Streptomyces sp. PA5.6 TaxID=3035651 RepID=UPI003904A310
MSISKEELSRLLKAALVKREKWDEVPELGVVYRSDTGVHRLAPWEFDRKVWGIGHPAQFLGYLGDHLLGESESQREAALGFLPAGSEPLGVYFRYEAYAASEDQADELRRRRLAGGSTPLLKDLAGRREFRSIQALTFDRVECAATQYREEPLSAPSEYSVLDGPVPDALLRIVTALTPASGDL